MIPKKIHYCWFGKNPLPELAQNCIASWKKYCPDYEIIEWNEETFDIESNAYVKEAYEAKKWAFVSDFVRLYALVQQGGVYMDTDVELLKPIDGFLSCAAFSGFEAADRIPTGIMACEQGHPLFTELLQDYDHRHFLLDNGEYDTTTNVTTITNLCLKHGLELNNQLQTVCGFTLYPFEFFCPKDSTTKLVHLTENTHCIHHFDGSWLTPEEQLFNDLRRKHHKWLPLRPAGYLAKAQAALKFRGISGLWKEIRQFFSRG